MTVQRPFISTGVIADPIEAARYKAAWRDRRRRILVFRTVAYGYIAAIAGFGFLSSVDSNIETNPVFIFAFFFVSYMVAGIWLNRFRCPRCGELYYWGWRVKGTLGRGNWRSCRHCGLPQDTGPLAQGDSGPEPGVASSPSNALALPEIIGPMLPGIVLVACLVLVNVRLLQSDAYKDSLQRALASPEIQTVLGGEPHQSSLALGFEFPFRYANFAEWSLGLKGSRASGHLYGVATQINGSWDVSRLVFISENGETKIELTPVQLLKLPPVPRKNVYIVPLDPAESKSLQWVHNYYKAKLGIDIAVLPPIALDPKVMNAARRQLNADVVISFLQEKYPDLARDPFSIVIGITSDDMYIPSYNWRYAHSYRREERFAVVSSARLHPPTPLGAWNPEWLNSRLQKILTKDLLILYFDLPKNNDHTSVLSAEVLSNTDLDLIGSGIFGAEGAWDSSMESGDPAVTIYDLAGREQLWRMTYIGSALADTGGQVFCADLEAGLLMQRKADFVFDDEPALQFTRVNRNQDDRSRAFGIGGSDSFDIFLGGQMGVAVDLILEDGSRIHYKHQPSQAGQSGDTYRAGWSNNYRFFGTQAVFSGGSWQIKTTDGWTYSFPYRPKALPQYVTVLTNFTDPAGHTYKMERDAFGALLSVTSSSGKWLHLENDPEHRIRKITSSTGRSVRYEYDSGGRMMRATDSDGRVDSYTFDEKSQMLTAGHGMEKPILTNEYFGTGNMKSQTMADGRRFAYFPVRQGNVLRETQIKDPNGLQTYIQYEAGGYLQSLPTAVPH